VLTFAEGPPERHGLTFAADGLHSPARAALNPKSRAYFTGQVAWRATVQGDGSLPAEAHVFMGPGRHLVRYPLRQGRLINIVAVEERDDWAAEGWHHTDDPANLRRPSWISAPRSGPSSTGSRRCISGASSATPSRRSGPMASLRFSATRRIPRCPSSRRAPTWRWRTAGASSRRSPPIPTRRRAQDLCRAAPPAHRPDRAGGRRQRHQLPLAPGSMAPRRPWRAAPRGPIRPPRRHRALRMAPWPRRHARRLTHRLGSPSSFRKYRSGEREGAKRPSPGSAPKATIRNDKVASAPKATIEKRQSCIGAEGDDPEENRRARSGEIPQPIV
jgi:hypothetical protein